MRLTDVARKQKIQARRRFGEHCEASAHPHARKAIFYSSTGLRRARVKRGTHCCEPCGCSGTACHAGEQAWAAQCHCRYCGYCGYGGGCDPKTAYCNAPPERTPDQRASAIRRAMRSSTGGWVENRFAMPPPDSGLTIIICAVAG